MSQNDLLPALQKLAELHQAGLLTVDEFQQAKARLLQAPPSLPPPSALAAPLSPQRSFSPSFQDADLFHTGGRASPSDPFLSPFSSPSLGKAGDLLGGRFRLERLLGQGGMGQVWLAHDILKGRLYALKCLLPALAHDPSFRAQFVRELTLTETLQHPGIIRTFDLQTDPSGLLFYTMEYVEGQTFETILTQARKSKQGSLPLFPISQVLDWLQSLAEILAYAHRQGVIHRDLKPSNILLATDGSLKLMDFGIAKALSQNHVTQHTGWKGTLHYVAPEQMRGGAALTPSADLYSLGVLAYELLTGDLPLGRFPSPRERILDLPPALDAAILRALDVSPANRFQNALAFQEAFLSKENSPLPLPAARSEARLQEGTAGSSTFQEGEEPFDTAGSSTFQEGEEPFDTAGSSTSQEGEEPFDTAGSSTSQEEPFDTLSSPSLRGASFVWCPPGTFRRGSGDSDKEACSDEAPAHNVTLTRGFWMKQTPVTQGEWNASVGSNPSHFLSSGADAPVESVSWYDAVWFCNELSKREGLPEAYRLSGLTGNPGQSGFQIDNVEFLFDSSGYRLPTEAEWEYAARAGTTEPRYGEIGEIAWYETNSGGAWYNLYLGGSTQAVKGKQPNAWNLFDMLGNVSEWCYDKYNPYEAEALVDPIGLADGSSRVYRGGAWLHSAQGIRVSFRCGIIPSSRLNILGFRLCRFA